MRRFGPLVACLLLAACARPELLSGTPEGAWIKEPLVSFGSPDRTAEEHCARFGKSAVFRATLSDAASGTSGGSGTYLPIRVYDCR